MCGGGSNGGVMDPRSVSALMALYAATNGDRWWGGDLFDRVFRLLGTNASIAQLPQAEVAVLEAQAENRTSTGLIGWNNINSTRYSSFDSSLHFWCPSARLRPAACCLCVRCCLY